MDPKALYLLIAVTNGGDVRLTHDIRGLEQCETARSLALYGMTQPEIREAEERRKVAERESSERWAAAHPPRPARPEDKDRCNPLGSDLGRSCSILPDGLVRDLQPRYGMSSPAYNASKGEDVIVIAGSFVQRYPGDARTARCVPEQ